MKMINFHPSLCPPRAWGLEESLHASRLVVLEKHGGS